jgi:hypothetical protein
MNIHYKIVDVYPNDHLIVARYWTDIINEEFLNSNPQDSNNRYPDGSIRRCRSDVSITLPTPTPTGVDLEKLILANAPIDWLQTLENVQNPNVNTDMSSIENLVGVVSVKTSDEIKQIVNTNQTQQLSDEEIAVLIAKIAER